MEVHKWTRPTRQRIWRTVRSLRRSSPWGPLSGSRCRWCRLRCNICLPCWPGCCWVLGWGPSLWGPMCCWGWWGCPSSRRAAGSGMCSSPALGICSASASGRSSPAGWPSGWSRPERTPWAGTCWQTWRGWRWSMPWAWSTTISFVTTSSIPPSPCGPSSCTASFWRCRGTCV